MFAPDADGFQHRGPLLRGHAVAGRVITHGQSVHDGRTVEILRRGIAVDGQRRGVQGVTHRSVAERLLAREQVGRREIHDGLRDHLAELVIHEIDERLFLEGRHPRRVARTRRGDGHEVHIQVPAGLAEQLPRFGIPLRPRAKGIDPVARNIEPVMRHRGDLTHRAVKGPGQQRQGHGDPGQHGKTIARIDKQPQRCPRGQRAKYRHTVPGHHLAGACRPHQTHSPGQGAGQQLAFTKAQD